MLAAVPLVVLGPGPQAYAAPAFEPADCPVEVPAEHVHRVRCGVLTVPERRGEGSDPGRTIRLPVAIIASHSSNPAPDPLVFPTAGGPGAGSFSSLWYFLEYADWAADERCQAHYPDFERSLITVLDNTRQTPLTFPAKHPHDRSPIIVVVRDTDISYGLFDALYDANLVRALPFVIDQLARGNHDVAAPLVQQNLDFADWFSEGLQTTIDCAEEIPFVDEELRAATYTGSELLKNQDFDPALPGYCATWDVPKAPASAVEGVVSDIPTLLTSGGYDPVTPPAYAGVAARGLSRHYAYTFPVMGHGAVWSNLHDPCPAAIAQ